jgi:hypothetical protein
MFIIFLMKFKTFDKMKLIIKTLICTLLVISVNSCKKDEVEDPKKTTPIVVDPCANITCLNGGYCANGSCVCPEGYSGSNCSQQVTPSLIRINSIRVTGWNPTDNGAGWDLTSGPDIYVLIRRSGTTVYTSATYTDASSQLNFNTNIEITGMSSTYDISIYDFDSLDSDDFMGGFTFVPYSSDNGFPSIITIQNSSVNNLKFELFVSYSY